jgi:hypothetical protein
MITLGDAVPLLNELRRRMRASEVHGDDLPATSVRRRYRVPEDAPVISRIKQLITQNRARWRRS